MELEVGCSGILGASLHRVRGSRPNVLEKASTRRNGDLLQCHATRRVGDLKIFTLRRRSVTHVHAIRSAMTILVNFDREPASAFANFQPGLDLADSPG
mgnify:CR=1 FL=1